MSDDIAVVRRLFARSGPSDLDRVLACYSDDVEITKAAAGCRTAGYGGVEQGQRITRRPSCERGAPCRVLRSLGLMRDSSATAQERYARSFITVP